jgi:hypothetical protein
LEGFLDGRQQRVQVPRNGGFEQLRRQLYVLLASCSLPYS